MSYRIQYGESAEKQTFSEKKGLQTKTLLYIGLACLFCALVFALNVYADAIWDYFLPGDPGLTRDAFNNLSEEIRSGTSVTDAVAAFCKEIIKSASY